jgi:hypothetical protein
VVDCWRFEQLLEAGYSEHDAEEIAARPSHEIDLHQAVDLLAACGDPTLAARILL